MGEMRKKKQFNGFNKSDDAVTGIVVAILLVGLFVTIFSIIQTIYVPQWMEEKESEHMNLVAAQFAQLKFATDIQLYSSGDTSMSITTPITLGCDRIPFFLSHRSYGSLEILSDAFKVTIQNDSSSSSYQLGTIKYSSRNSYFVDQTLCYESGSIIVSQYQGGVLSAPAFFSVNKTQMINISLTLVNISGVGAKTSAHGYSTSSISTKYLETYDQTATFTNITQIMINTSYPYVWKEFLNETLRNEGLSYGTKLDYWITFSQNDGWVILHFNTGNNANVLRVKVKKIAAQLSPGKIS